MSFDLNAIVFTHPQQIQSHLNDTSNIIDIDLQ
uniref:Uncharacterized protein n=1 Tax=viral metagenome TaxID=1070528 RepID=A0A6C0CRH9_9ZZZZ